MRISSRYRMAVGALVLAALVTTGCHSGQAAPPAQPTAPSPTSSARSAGATSRMLPPPAGNDYADAVRAALNHHLQVWLEADLVKRWQQGRASFNSALVQLGQLAAIPGVRGIKIADELGYHDGLTSRQQVAAFLTDASTGLRQFAPGKPLLVDMIVPDLGCLPVQDPPLLWSTECQVKADGQYPQLSVASVTSYLQAHTISVLDLSAGLLPDNTYAGWGVTRDIAEQQAWAKVNQLGWPSLVTMHSRKALAHPGAYDESVPATKADLKTWVDLPLAAGAKAVDIWTWRQKYQGAINRLLDPGLKPNALWLGLVQRHQQGDQLFTHLSPHSLEMSLDADLAMLAKAFSAVFIAAGTG